MPPSMWDIMESDDPAVIEQNHRWLEEVQPQARQALEKRLRGSESDYRSARMELFLHQVFSGRGFTVEWEPALPGTRRVTEFRASFQETTILVEAKVSGVERAIQEHSDIDEPLRERFEALGLPDVLTFEFVGTPPPLHRLDEVWGKARRAVEKAESQRTPDASAHFLVRLTLAGSVYEFEFTLAPPIGDNSEDKGLVITSTSVLKLQPERKLYYDIEHKATRYGTLSEPFFITVWSRHVGREGPELGALYGTKMWTEIQEGHDSRWVETRQGDGIFTVHSDEGHPRYAHVSAVAFVRSSSPGGSVDDSLVIYHNPFADRPLDTSILAGFQQLVPDGDHMRWIPDGPAAE